MYLQDSHCSYCGHPFPTQAGWPRRCLTCGNASYKNPLPVVVVLLPMGSSLVVIRRGIEPSRGTLTLPGGYLDCGETWQQGGSRELLEETGIAVPPEKIQLFEVMNGLDDTLVVFGLAEPQPRELLKPFRSDETEEVTLIEGPVELGFPNHTEIVARYYRRRKCRAD